ncbi:phage tail sheath subtilisin-like domain-containing protein [soil metagenome]|jgi:phage tail sheath protein FI
MASFASPGVYIEELESAARPIEGVGTAVAAFVGLTADGPMNEPVLVTNWSSYVSTFGEPVPGTYLGHSVYGYFLNGGGKAYVVRVGGPASNEARAKARTELTAAADPALATYVVTALSDDDGQISVEITDPPEGSPEETFRIVVRSGDREEEFSPVSTKRGRGNIVNTVNATSTLIRVAETKSETVERRPANGTVSLVRSHSVSAAPRPAEYVGSTADRTGFGGLEAIDGITMVCVPDLMAAFQSGAIDADGVQAVQTAMIAHCELMGDRMAILDPPPDLSTQQVLNWRVDTVGYDSKFAALYYPWLKYLDPLDGKAKMIPPSGFMAGVWARNDATRGVHKAPANEIVRGVLGVANAITRGEHDLLNPVGINCVRPFAGRGTRIWGARTLSSDPAWRYINVRRLYNYVESSLQNGTQWVVFEPNSKDLWERLNRTIRSFLFQVWASGGLFGDTVDQAFYVKCDDETNPSESIEAGQLICEIGMAVVKPAEFVVFRLAQLPSGISAISE